MLLAKTCRNVAKHTTIRERQNKIISKMKQDNIFYRRIAEAKEKQRQSNIFYFFTLFFTLFFAFSMYSFALVPPTNYFGFIKNGTDYISDARLAVYSDCFGSYSLLLKSATKYSKGYYDINIPTDDSSTAVVEGCSPGKRLVFVFTGNGFNYNDSFIISKVSVSERHDFDISSGSTDNAAIGSAIANSGKPYTEGSKSMDTEQNNAASVSGPAKVPVLPVNYFGFVFVDGNYIPDNLTIKVYSTCFNSKESNLDKISLLKATHASYNKGYYDLYIPIDDPSTDKDEGCTEGDRIIFDVAGLYAENNTNIIVVARPGTSAKHNVYFTSMLNPKNNAKASSGELPSRVSALPGHNRYNAAVVVLFFVLIVLIFILVFGEKSRKNNTYYFVGKHRTVKNNPGNIKTNKKGQNK